MEKDHVAIVTGGAGGIGLSTVLRLAKRGVSVLIGDIDEEAGTSAAAKASSMGLNVSSVALDVTDRASWQAAVKHAAGRFGAVDILVNCAGMLRDSSIGKMSDDDWDTVLAVNLKGSWLGCQAVLPSMKEKKWGRIVNISSSSHRGTYGQTNYAAAKAGIFGLTRTVALEGMKAGILVNAVAPHTVATPILDRVPQDVKDGWLAKSKVGRFAEPEEIAVVVDFFTSDENTFVNGQILEVDGGELVGA